MLSNEPPLASAAAHTAENAEFAVTGELSSAMSFLYAGLVRSANEVGQALTIDVLQPIETYPP